MAMTREESWEVAPDCRLLLRHIQSLGFTVSVHRVPASLYGTRLASTEFHAVNVDAEPPDTHVVSIEGEHGDVSDYECAVMLAQSVGIDLEDG